jgi:hypothetical protein
MRNWLHVSFLATFAAGLIAPSVASATVVVQIDTSNLVATAEDHVVVLDVFAIDYHGDVEERINGFDVTVRSYRMLTPFSPLTEFTPDGVRFLPPVRLPGGSRPYLFEDFEGVVPVDANSTYKHMHVTAALPDPRQWANIGPVGAALFGLPVFIPGDVEPGYYAFGIEPGAALRFTTSGAPVSALATSTPFTYLPIPEPTAVACSAAAAGVLLRRAPRGGGRRRHGAAAAE